MNRCSLTGIIATALSAASITFGVFLWIGASKSDVSLHAAREDARRPAPVCTDTTEARLPFAESEESDRTTEFSAEDSVDMRLASLANLAHTNPLAAAAQLETVPSGEERTIAMRIVFREWAAISPRDALAWISAMGAEQDRNEAREFVCHRVAEEHPKLAFDLAWQIGEDTATPLVQDLAQQWAGADVAAARDWALALPVGTDRDQILSRVCRVLSQSDPSSAGAIVSREIPAGPVQDEAAMSVLHQWAIRDFTSASEWITHFPEGSLRIRAEEELAGIGEHQANSVETR